MYRSARSTLDELETRLTEYRVQPGCPHDPYVVICVEEAIAAAREGNFGVGAALVDGKGMVAVREHNHVFHPHFRSDLHAEMTVMTRFEDGHPEVREMSEYTLFTSLEPCPMCLARLIGAGVPRVYHAALDVETGMATHLERFGPHWVQMAKGLVFTDAQCSDELKAIALEVYLNTGNTNIDKHERRKGVVAHARAAG